MDSQLAWLAPIVTTVVTGLSGAIAYLYRRQSATEEQRANRAEVRADALQKVINDRAEESEQIAREMMRENAGLKADMAVLQRVITTSTTPRRKGNERDLT